MNKEGIRLLATCPIAFLRATIQKTVLESNALYDLSVTLNFGGEVRCDDTFT